MADNIALGLLGAMDHLWFHHVILFSEPSSPKPLLAASKSVPSSSSSNHSQTSSVLEEERQDDHQCNKQENEKGTTPVEIETERERPKTRLNLITVKTRSHSSSPATPKQSKNNLRSAVRLQKSMSCKSLCELELEEVKGFMDLGFRFNKHHLSKRMMSVIPGLQRLELLKNEEVSSMDDGNTEEEEEENGSIHRPYLSEAWLIKRPDSPLLNLRMPRASTAADMKKHLKYWAKTVASAIQQES